MLVAVKRLREIKCFKFLFKSCGAGFVVNVGRESVPCGRSTERERSLAELGSETWSGVTVDRVDFLETGSTTSAR